MQPRGNSDSPDGALARERRPPVGIARERETSTDNASPCQREFRTLSQPRMATAHRSPYPGPRLFHDLRGAQEYLIMSVFSRWGRGMARRGRAKHQSK